MGWVGAVSGWELNRLGCAWDGNFNGILVALVCLSIYLSVRYIRALLFLIFFIFHFSPPIIWCGTYSSQRR